MKALTISQPHANFVMTPEKPVENRGRDFSYRGPLLIHAGKGTQYLTREELAGYPHGVLLGVCELANCLHLSQLQRAHPLGSVPGTRLIVGAVLQNVHTCGPYCLFLTNKRKFRAPIPYRGAQGLFEVPDELVSEAIACAEEI